MLRTSRLQPGPLVPKLEGIMISSIKKANARLHPRFRSRRPTEQWEGRENLPINNAPWNGDIVVVASDGRKALSGMVG